MSVRSRYGSPSRSSLNDRYESPPPYRRYTRGESPIRSRSPSARIRIRPRSYCEAPTPPASFTPPPAVAGYSRPSVVSVPLEDNYASPRVPPSQFAPNSFSRPLYPTAPPHEWSAPRSFRILDAPNTATPGLPTPGNCVACRASPACHHYPILGACTRPVTWWDGIRYHPPCIFCTQNYPPAPPAPMPIPPIPDPAAGMHVPRYPFAVPPPPPPPPPAPHWPAFPRTPSPVGLMPPTPNPYSPLSTPSLSSHGGSVSGKSTMSAPQTPVSGSVEDLAAAVGPDDSSSRGEARGGDERLRDVKSDDGYD
jgi:Wiskott-Aldrich syndrome protein